jgi:choline dehydrogenase-like flavoprotein
MLIDIGELADGQEIETRVCIVGSGPTGLALARELYGAGEETLIVESGEVELSADAARLDEGSSVGRPGVGMTTGRGRALGGTSRLWAGQCLPFDPLDLEPRAWVADSGWPLSLPDLQPFLERAEDFFAVRGQPYDERVWGPFGLSPLPFDELKLRHLATVYTPEPDLGARFRDELARTPGVKVLLRATATRIETGEGRRRASGLVARGLDGREVRVRAKAVVLCAGAIENARLLLLSDGLGNDRDLVGRYFQDHPNAHLGTVETTDPEALLDRYCLLYRKPLRYFPKIGLAPELQRERQILNAIANLIVDFGEDTGLEALKRLYRARRAGARTADGGRDLVRVARGLPQLARNYPRFRRGLSPIAPVERIVLQVHVEQAPDRESRVTLGDRADPLGQPVAAVDWRIGAQDVETARVALRAVSEEISRLGLGAVRAADGLDDGAEPSFSGAYHHVGTTRMADDPSAGVVDRDCAVHGVAGLYCCGGSVFPTGGAANPTLTMVALAIRLADRLKRQPAT